MADAPRPQKRGNRIAMTPQERDAFLMSERTCRVATVGLDGPHNTALWFLWDGSYLWMQSIVRAQRWADLQRDQRVAIVVDSGSDYLELRGVEILGSVEFVGEQPRTGEPHPELAVMEPQFFSKYFNTTEVFHDGKHAWMRVKPTKISSWDFRKLASL
jgi:Pyridoxamine 5'-phosphate oxidase